MPWASPMIFVDQPIEEGRKAARGVDKDLMFGKTYLP